MRKRTRVAAGVAAVALTTGGAWSAYGAGASASSDHQGWPTSSRSAGAALSAARAEAARSGTQVLTVIARTSAEAEVDVGESGPTPGDYFLFEDRLWNANGTRLIGRDSGRCMLGIRTFTCDATVVIFGRGKLTVSGTVFNESDSRLPIVGGTANFKTARGQLTVAEDGATTMLIFQIIR